MQSKTEIDDYSRSTAEKVLRIIGGDQTDPKVLKRIAISFAILSVMFAFFTTDLYSKIGIITRLLSIERNVYDAPNEWITSQITWSPDPLLESMPEIPAGLSAQFVPRPIPESGGDLLWQLQPTSSQPVYQAQKEDFVRSDLFRQQNGTDRCAAIARDVLQVYSRNGKNYWFLTVDNSIFHSENGGATCELVVDETFQEGLTTEDGSTARSPSFSFVALAGIFHPGTSLDSPFHLTTVAIGDNQVAYDLENLDDSRVPSALGLFRGNGDFTYENDLPSLNTGEFNPLTSSLERIPSISLGNVAFYNNGDELTFHQKRQSSNGNSLILQSALPFIEWDSLTRQLSAPRLTFSSTPAQSNNIKQQAADQLLSDANNGDVNFKFNMKNLRVLDQAIFAADFINDFQILSIDSTFESKIASSLHQDLAEEIVLRGTPTGLPAAGWIRSATMSSDGSSIWIAASQTQSFSSLSRPVIYYSNDSGLNFKELNEALGMPPLVRWFASIACALLIIALGAYYRAKTIEENNKGDAPSAGAGITDSPIGLLDRDVLGLKRLALGIARVIYNVGTSPPLTFGIVGSWGSGKSSLMNMLQQELHSRSGRVIWFNAWHHQSEEHILAALLEAVRQNAVPPVWSGTGLRFRGQLFLRRRAKLLNFALPYMAVLVGLFILSQTNSQVGQSISLLSENIAKIEDGVIALLAGLPLLISIYKIVKPFNFSASDLSSRAASLTNILPISGDMGARHTFQKQFADVTSVLNKNGKDITIIIDDLDRCSPANVRMVLDAINFLTSAGMCYIVVGFDKDRVLGLLEKEYENDQISDNPHEAPHLVAERYLSKIINVEISVPNFENEQAVELLKNLVQDDRQQEAEQAATNEISEYQSRLRFGRFFVWVDGVAGLFSIGIFAMILMFLASSVLINLDDDNVGNSQKVEHAPSEIQKSNLVEQVANRIVQLQNILDDPKLAGLTDGKNSRMQIGLFLQEGTTKSIESDTSGSDENTEVTALDPNSSLNTELTNAEVEQLKSELKKLPVAGSTSPQIINSGSLLWPISLFIFVLLVFLLDRMGQKERRLNTIADSDTLANALAEWAPVIQGRDKTPRNAKQFLNYTRLVKECIIPGSHINSGGPNISDDKIVALSAANLIAPSYIDELAKDDRKRPELAAYLTSELPNEQNKIAKIISHEDAKLFRSFFR